MSDSVSENKQDPELQGLSGFEAKVNIPKAIPFGLQHVLAMFVANLVPIALVAAAGGLDGSQTAMLMQNAMVVAGIGTLIQLFGIWRVGARLPIVMGVSFTFVTVLCGIAATYGMGTVVGAVIAGGIIEGVLGLFAVYWYRFITPVVSGLVVATIGFSLLSVGATSFAGGSGAADFASLENLALGACTLLACLVFQGLARGTLKQLSILFGLVFGYVIALFMGKVDFSIFQGVGVVSLPQVMPFAPEFNVGAIISITLLFLVSAAETIGDTAAVASAGFDRDATNRELQGSIMADGLASALAGVFGCSPLTSFAQNIGLIAMTHVVNRRAIACGAVALIAAGFVPAIGALFSSVPDSVLGGCTLMMFGSIIVTGFQMVAKAGFTQRNMTIAATSLAIGIGFTQVDEIFTMFPELVQNVFVNNSVALTFVVALLMSLLLPKDADGDDGAEGAGDAEIAAPAEGAAAEGE